MRQSGPLDLLPSDLYVHQYLEGYREVPTLSGAPILAYIRVSQKSDRLKHGAVNAAHIQRESILDDF